MDDDLAHKLREELEVSGVPWHGMAREKCWVSSWNVQVRDQSADWFKSEFSMMFRVFSVGLNHYEFGTETRKNMFPPTRTLLHTQHVTSTYLNKG